MGHSRFTDLEALLHNAVTDGIIPGAVLCAKSLDNSLDYTFSVGQSKPDTTIAPDTVFALASMTKLPATIAVLQLIEDGKVTLDEDVSRHVPELASYPILSEDGTESKREGAITLRALLTHSSGVTYPFISPHIQDWKLAKTGGTDPREGATVETRYGTPLVFQPGTGWKYGAGIDWAGKVLEAVSGVKLGDWIKERILTPLGVSSRDVTFFPAQEDGLVGSGRLARMAVRGNDGRVKFIKHDAKYDENVDAFGGEGLYATIPAYTKILESLLRDDGKLVSHETTKKMYLPSLPTAEAKTALLKELETPEWIVGVVPHTNEYDWGLGGLLVDGDSHPYRRRGCLFWGGMFNLTWFVDREAGVCGAFGTQVLPGGDAQVRVLHERFEEVVYGAVGGRGSGKL